MALTPFPSSNLDVRPCERRNFPNFLFSQVSELFGYQSSEIFWKYPFFSNTQKFLKNSSEISLGQKNLFLRQKQGFWGQKQGFPNIPKLRNIWNLFYSKFSKKMTLKSSFKNRKKNSFRLQFQLKHSSSILECRALLG